MEKETIIFFGMEEHSGVTLRNLIYLIYSRGQSLSRATGGYFFCEKALAEAMGDDRWTYSRRNFLKRYDAFKRQYGKCLYGLELDSQKICFNGFEEAVDEVQGQTYRMLAELVNRQALRQKRVLINRKENFDRSGNDKRIFAAWLTRIGMSGDGFREERKILLKNFDRNFSRTFQKGNLSHQGGMPYMGFEDECGKKEEEIHTPEEMGRLSEEGGRNAASAKRVAAYIRVSTDREDQENSYETQERYFRQLLSGKKEWRSAGIYADYGVSGTSSRKRIGFCRLLRHCREGRIDHIVTKSISRFARNTADFMMALAMLRDTGVTIFFEKERIDTSSAVNEFVLTTLAAIAQEESRSISASTCWGNQRQFMLGNVKNRDIYGYRFSDREVVTENGYRLRDVEIVEDEAKTVRWIFQEFVKGKMPRELARELNRRQVPQKLSVYAKKRMESPSRGQLRADIHEGWTSEQIVNVLQNERYTGEVLTQKTYTENYLTHKIRRNKGERIRYRVRDHHPAIISRELYDRAREIWEIRAAAGASRSGRKYHGFSGRLICGCCGRFYTVRNAKRHPIWFCPSTTRNNGRDLCRSEEVYEEQLFRVFRKAIGKRFYFFYSSDDHLPFSDRGAGQFTEQLLEKLRQVQQMDTAEQDRAFLQRQIMGSENERERERLSRKLAYMEDYWERLEADSKCREETIAWMSRLPPGREGALAFMNGIDDKSVRALVLSISVYDPYHYRIHWFDDTKTEVEMDTNVESFRGKKTDGADAERGGRYEKSGV